MRRILKKFNLVSKKEYDELDEDRRKWFCAYDAEVQKNRELIFMAEKNKELNEQIIELKKELADVIQKRFELAEFINKVESLETITINPPSGENGI